MEQATDQVAKSQYVKLTKWQKATSLVVALIIALCDVGYLYYDRPQGHFSIYFQCLFIISSLVLAMNPIIFFSHLNAKDYRVACICMAAAMIMLACMIFTSYVVISPRSNLVVERASGEVIGLCAEDQSHRDDKSYYSPLRTIKFADPIQYKLIAGIQPTDEFRSSSDFNEYRIGYMIENLDNYQAAMQKYVAGEKDPETAFRSRFQKALDIAVYETNGMMKERQEKAQKDFAGVAALKDQLAEALKPLYVGDPAEGAKCYIAQIRTDLEVALQHQAAEASHEVIVKKLSEQFPELKIQ